MSNTVLKSQEFYPSHLNHGAVRLCQSISYLIAHFVYRLDLEIEPTCLDKLRALSKERIVLLPNHPTFSDGIALFLLSTRLREIFNYLVAYENFQGLQGKLMQLLGAYSIRRGLADRQSVAQTLKLLSSPTCRLVIFPEGGCSFQNDTVMPFRSGAIQLPLLAMNKLAKQDPSVPNLYLVPVSLKYRYTSNMSKVIAETLSRLEKVLNISITNSDFYQRLRLISEAIIVKLEQEYGLNNGETAQMDWNQRIACIKTHVLQSCEQQLDITPAPNTPSRERVYKIQYVLKSRAQDLSEEDLETDESIQQAAVRLLNFDAIYDGYVAATPTAERFLDTLIRLEREVFKIDQPQPKGHRKVIIYIGEPVNLKDHFESYKQKRLETVEALTQQLRQTVQTNLDEINRLWND